jgi:hypothetical protein
MFVACKPPEPIKALMSGCADALALCVDISAETDHAGASPAVPLMPLETVSTPRAEASTELLDTTAAAYL